VLVIYLPSYIFVVILSVTLIDRQIIAACVPKIETKDVL